MATILVGGISPEAEQILTRYVNNFIPDAIIEPLKAVGLKGTLKRRGATPDVMLIIIDSYLYEQCYSVCSEVLNTSKVHKYTSDNLLEEFLISKFGKLEGVVSDVVTTPKEDDTLVTPDVLMQQEAESLITTTVSEDEEDNLTVSDSVDNTNDLQQQVDELKDKLASSEMMVRNLTLQLEDNQSGNEISELVNRIKELETQLEDAEQKLSNNAGDDYVALGKIAKAEKVIKEFDNLKADLKKAREDNSAVEFEKSKLAEELNQLKVSIEELNTQISTLQSELSIKTEEIVKLQEENDKKDEELTQKEATLQGIQSEISLLQEQLDNNSNLESELSKAKEDLNNLNIKTDELKIDLENKVNECSKLQAQVEELKSTLTIKETELEEKTNELSQCSENNSASEEEIISLMEETNSLRTEISKLNDIISNKDTEISSLRNKLDELEALRQADMSQSDTVNNELAELRSALASKEALIKNMEDTAILKAEETKVKSDALDTCISEKTVLEEKLVTMQEKNIELQGNIDTLNSQIKTMQTTQSNELADKDKLFSELEQEKVKLEKKVETLQNNLIESQADSESIKRLEEDLLEERRKSARLTSEVEVLKKSEGSGKSAELRIEIAKLNEELRKSKASSVNTEELEAIKQELTQSRAKVAELEMTVLDTEEQIAELSSGVFAQMANLAMPKVAYDIKVPFDLDYTNEHIYCYASGSEESSSTIYSTIRRSCMANPKARIIILDLTTDSTIDRDFGINQVKSPIPWLTGSNPFTDFLADTKFNNVKVLSTALAYMNDLFLLQVDWNKRIEELKLVADAVIINVGCINNLIPKVLFNSFSMKMKSHIIVKATPINLRTTVLNITGFKQLSNLVTVDCVNFDNNSSKVMYQRLAQKCNATIIKDTDIIAL